MIDSNTDSPTIQISTKSGYIALVSHEDADLLKRSWSRTPFGYLRRDFQENGQRRHEFIHRIILERMLERPLVKGEMVDHIDRNSANNTRANLRLASHAENMQNRKAMSSNKSGYRGVSWSKRHRKWKCAIRANKQYFWLGHFQNAKDAALAYNEAAILLHGEFAQLNVIED